jgi:hypothetical protein
LIKEDPALDLAGAAQISHVRPMVARRQRVVKIPSQLFGGKIDPEGVVFEDREEPKWRQP